MVKLKKIISGGLVFLGTCTYIQNKDLKTGNIYFKGKEIPIRQTNKFEGKNSSCQFYADKNGNGKYDSETDSIIYQNTCKISTDQITNVYPSKNHPSKKWIRNLFNLGI
jgi:hypothetical protein